MTGMLTMDKLRVIHAKVKKQLEGANEDFRCNFVLTDFSKSFNGKLARKFLKARVVKSVGSNAYLLMTFKAAVWQFITPRTYGCDLKEGKTKYMSIAITSAIHPVMRGPRVRRRSN